MKTLSDKIHYAKVMRKKARDKRYDDVIRLKDVKQFIKDLKEEFNDDSELWDNEDIYDKINTLTGHKLTEEKEQ